jgi:hypothetical protein
MFSHLEKNLYLQYSHRYNNSFSELLEKSINSTNNIKENYFNENYLYISMLISNYIKTYDIMEIFSHILIIYVLIYILYNILYYTVIISSFMVNKIVKLIYYPFKNSSSKQIKNNMLWINNTKYNNSKEIEKYTNNRLELEKENNSIGIKYIRRRSLRLIEQEKNRNKEAPF